jgi:hypothetical protein
VVGGAGQVDAAAVVDRDGLLLRAVGRQDGHQLVQAAVASVSLDEAADVVAAAAFAAAAGDGESAVTGGVVAEADVRLSYSGRPVYFVCSQVRNAGGGDSSGLWPETVAGRGKTG